MATDTDTVCSELNAMLSFQEMSESNTEAISKLLFTTPEWLPLADKSHPSGIEKDRDGDLILKRNHHNEISDSVVYIGHRINTTLDCVGEQLWLGALLLSDFILHNATVFKDKKILEFGCGVGLTSIVASTLGRKVIATDIDHGNILSQCKINVERNSHLCACPIEITPLNWLNLENLDSSLTDFDIALAADTIYDSSLTEAFFKVLEILLVKNKQLYLALEKRYVFTCEDLDTVAPMYEHFLQLLRKNSKWDAELLDISSIRQFFNYERSKHLVLWHITSKE